MIKKLSIMKQFFVFLLSIFLFSSFSKPHAAAWKLIWSDEFAFNGLPDSTKWSYDVGGNGWGNNELGILYRKDPRMASRKWIPGHRNERKVKNANHTSARLVTKSKADWKYGGLKSGQKVPRGSAPGRDLDA